jgi:hypothetical protein
MTEAARTPFDPADEVDLVIPGAAIFSPSSTR